MTFTHWKNHFIENKKHFDFIEWNTDIKIDKNELKTIQKSIQHFQYGENSEGKNLVRSAEKYFENSEDKSYIDTVKLFIKEEQSHAQVLKQFMDSQQIPEIKGTWSDSIFRFIRKGSNLERSISILVSAEVLATVFYIAFDKATSSPVLKNICKQILRDEEHHINFQAFTLHQIYKDRSELHNLIHRLLHLGLMTSAIVVAYFVHRKLLTKTGFGFFKYVSLCFKEFFRLHKMTFFYELKPSVKSTLQLQAI